MNAKYQPPAGITPSIGRPRVTDERSIIEAVLAEGLADFTVTGVAKRLKITHGTLYRYFRSREDLAVAAINAVVADATWVTSGLPWREMLDRFASTLWQLCQSAPGFAGCVLMLTRTPDGIVQVIDRYVARLEALGMRRGDAQVLIDLIGEEVLVTAMLLARAGADGVEVPELGEVGGPGAGAGAGAGWLDRKLKLIFDGAAYQLGESREA